MTPHDLTNIDLIVIVMLVVTIIATTRLSRRLSYLRTNRAEFEALVHQITQATQKAEASVSQLKLTSQQISETIQTHLRKADQIRDDLDFLVSRSEKAAQNLEKVLEEARHAERKVAAPAAAPVRQEPSSELLRHAEPEIIKEKPAKQAPQVIMDEDDDAEDIDDLYYEAPPTTPVRRVVQPAASPSPTRRGAPMATASSETDLKPRTKEEEDLLRALRSLR